MSKSVYCLCGSGGKTKASGLHKKEIRDKENQAKGRKNNQILEPKRILCGIDWRFKMKN